MTDTPTDTGADAGKAPDYKDTVFLPKTDFPMRAGLAQKEPEILARWQKMGLYERLRKERKGREKFVLHDGPPYANGNIHIGHALNKTLKDLVVRSQTLLGKDAPYVPGWDCHGLPIEWKIEEQYRKKKRNKDEVPAAEFRAECRNYADQWVNVQREEFKRLGIMGEWDNPYLTMDYNAEAAIVGELLKFAESGQLYRGAKPVMWSPVEKTALAEAEVEYEDIVSTQIDVAFEIVEAPLAPELVGAHAVIWTTTPWTIPVNQALAYGADVEYVLVQFNSDNAFGWSREENRAKSDPAGWIFDLKLLIAKQLKHHVEIRISKLISEALDKVHPNTKTQASAEIIWEGTGSQLAGAVAKHPMAGRLSPLPFRGGAGGGEGPRKANSGRDHSPHPNPSPEGEGLQNAEFYARPRPFLDGSHFVTTDAGTGLVHMAPDHGEDDFDLCKAHGINPVFAVDADGVYREDWAWLPRGNERAGSVINKNFVSSKGPICEDLRSAGALLSASDDFQHSYPHSWRSKAKIIYRCTPQWFVPMDKVIDRDVARCANEAEIRAAQGDGETLRDIALHEIRNTVRFVPERGKRRLESMVEGRPDWVLSRQRAWGVPIALYVNRKTGEYLNDPAVNARIIAAFEQGGADAWFGADHQTLLGQAYALDDYEVITDILDVWFDSGSTHAFVLESGNWPDLQSPADLYLEGSDQHRGWFQSSLLESCGTRGRAPYKALLTHGMTLDKTGRKMSKSLGNTLDPKKVIDVQGADILRLWVASVDYTEDHRIGDEILKGVGDSYRKLRNTFRYLLGALADFDESERVAYADMPELERYALHRLAELDAKLKDAVNDFAFSRYMRMLTDFAQDDLSAFFFDIRKDRLYCDVGPKLPQGTPERRAYRTVLDTLFHALVRYVSPVLCFTAEEVWQARFADENDSVHLKDWPEVEATWSDAALAEKWDGIRNLRALVTEKIEPLRRDKIIRSSLEAEVWVDSAQDKQELAEIFITADVHEGALRVQKTAHDKCGRCWRHLPDVSEDGALCGRCEEMVA